MVQEENESEDSLLPNVFEYSLSPLAPMDSIFLKNVIPSENRMCLNKVLEAMLHMAVSRHWNAYKVVDNSITWEHKSSGFWCLESEMNFTFLR